MSITGTIPPAVTQDVFPYTAGEALVYGNAVYLAADKKIYKARADSINTMPCIGLTTQAGDASTSVQVKRGGQFINPVRDAVFALGETLYVSPVNAGSLTNIPPGTLGQVFQEVGFEVFVATVSLDPVEPIIIGN